MFTVVNGVLLRRLPLREQEQLVVVWAEDVKSRNGHLPFSYGTFAALRERRGAFESLAGIDYNGAWSMAAEVGEATTTLRGGIVAGDFFGVLGVKPVLGRVLSAADDMVGGPHVLVISYGLWRRAFGGDPHVLGKTLRLKGVAHTIVGVLPQGFEYPEGRTSGPHSPCKCRSGRALGLRWRLISSADSGPERRQPRRWWK